MVVQGTSGGDMLWGMRPLMFLLFATLALAQQGEDARPLLRQVVEAARNAKSWRAEGSVKFELKGEGIALSGETQRKEAVSDSSHARVEMTIAGVPMLYVCDGTSTWTILPASNQYQKLPGIQKVCPTSPGGWANLLDNLQSAVVTGRDTVQFGGVSTPCDVIRAQYSWLPVGAELPGAPEMPATGSRTMCIDRSRLLILRDYIEAGPISSPTGAKNIEIKGTVAYSSIALNPELPAGLFEYQPPPGSTPLSASPATPGGTGAPLAAQEPLPPRVYPVGSVTAPTLIFKAEPRYTQEARAARIEGAVLLGIEVDAEGVPRNLRVLRSLDPGLDQNAIDTVSKWRFRPAMKGGEPVTASAKVEVNFRLSAPPPLTVP